jgi:hypothetical protein
MLRRQAALLASALSVSIAPARALADGAFPDELTLFAPKDKPRQVIVSTNFGLIVTNDDTQTWSWVCEQAITTLPFNYVVGPPPLDIAYALNVDGVFVSNDLCRWTQAKLGMMAKLVNDVFPDPSDGRHVLALARPTTTSTPTDYLLESKDGGFNFDDVLFAAPPGGRLESVEIAKSDPRRIYMVMSLTKPIRRILLRSTDAGMHWDMIDQSAFLRPAGNPMASPRLMLILQVDPTNPLLIYLRVLRNSPDASDEVAISDDGGSTLRTLFKLPGTVKMSCFLLLLDGKIVVGTRSGGFISGDHGVTFGDWTALQLRGLAYRDGTIYAAADNFADGFAAGASTDLGQTWKPILTFDRIGPPLDCPEVHTACDSQYPGLEMMFGIDGGVSAPAVDGGGTNLGRTPSGCHCDAGAGGSTAIAMLVLALAAIVLLAKRKIGR